MAMLTFDDAVKLKTKKIVFEDVFQASDATSLEQLKELTSKRKAFAEMSGVPTSHSEQDLQKLEQYIPLLENFVYHIRLAGDKSKITHLISNLKIRWSSSLISSSSFSICSTKFFQIKDLQFEVSMTVFLYGSMLRQRASDVISLDLVQSATFYRKAAGVYDYLGRVINPYLQSTKAAEKPPEISSSLASVMRLICLAEAQAVTIKKAEENGSSAGLVAKLHRGAAQLFDEASQILSRATKEYKDISSRLSDYISSSKALYELKSEKYFGEAHAKDHKMGVALGLLPHSIKNARKKISGEDSWRQVLKSEIDEVASILKKYERENELVWQQKLGLPHELPTPEATILVKHIAYVPESWERAIALKI